ncbi:MAG: hypothetical protein ABMA02_17135, partial [Saprospiraceae bacterium]
FNARKILNFNLLDLFFLKNKKTNPQKCICWGVIKPEHLYHQKVFAQIAPPIESKVQPSTAFLAQHFSLCF